MTDEKTKEKKARRKLTDYAPADREMEVMRKCRTHLSALETPEARVRVVNWLSAVAHSEIPARQNPIPPSQLTLDDLPEG